MNFYKNNSLYIFLFFGLLLVLYHAFGYFGHYGFDDMYYARLAKDLADGTLVFDNSFSFRFGILIPLAISYFFFGVSDFSSSLPSLIVSLSILFLVYSLVKKYGNVQTFLALSLTVLMHPFLFHSDKIMADIYVALFLFLSVYWIDRYRFTVKKNEALYAFLFALSLLFAFISKETVVLFLPLPITLFFIDLYQKRSVRFWIYSLFFGVLLLVAYFTVLWMITGDVFKRFDVLTSANQAQSYAFSYDKQPLAILLKRIMYEFFASLVTEGTFILYALLLPVLFTGKWKEALKVDSSFSLFFISSFVLLLSANFMTISPFSYHPVPLDPRHTLFLIPISAIAASFVLREFLFLNKKSMTLALILAATAIAAYFAKESVFYGLFLPTFALILAYSLVNRITKMRTMFLVLFAAILAVTPYRFFVYSRYNVRYNLQKEIVFKHFVQSKENAVVFTDPMQTNVGNYYLEFDTTGHCKFVNYVTLSDTNYNPQVQKYLFLNFHTQFYSNTLNKKPFFAKNIASTYTLVFENKKHGIYIYKIPKVTIPEISGLKMAESKNDFEVRHENWTYNENHRETKMHFSGKYSSRLEEFSATFRLPLDSAIQWGVERIFIKCDLHFLCTNKAGASLVFVVENEAGSQFWEGKNIDNEIHVLEKWNHTKFETVIEARKITPGSVLKVYVWNPQKGLAYIDDFEVQVYGLK